MIDDEQQEAELPLESAGAQLTRARQAAGKSLADISKVTKISERQLAAIEAGNFAALPSRAYAVGFTRTYAKAVGLDSAAVIDLVREELARLDPDHARRTVPAFEPGDPARLPGRRVAWYAAAGLAVVMLVGFLVWPNLYAPGGSLPSILPSATPSAAAPVAAPAPAPANGPVVFTATRDQVWVRFADGNGQQLLQKVLALGESWTVPENAGAVTLTTARPDGLAVTIAGRIVPPLSDREQTMRDVPVTAAALLARGTGPVAAPLASPAPVTTSAANPPRRESRPVAEPRTEAPGAAVANPVAAPASAPPAGTGTADTQG
ncbi:helix-turn-helix domain-containing protein [Novosphingobium ginsenosidimutans]|uniref:Helix-turn-helix domain-containing protein n=1 Tax=Novosphingobium ginsenosidimutans TaxID=1176536 RepID=A0A5B8S2M2_9SPHN|nr:helix-turn-helix domain-containing protein [Novosphingobium ginsenosidimutans]QEA15368.1 helix-turn-helix domain-containing protein [Novosphingobium ginsenosidimutans]